MEETRLEMVSMALINEPDVPVRSTMDDQRMLDLIESLKENGLLVPIAVRPVGERYEVIYGHRRFIAARSLRWPEIRALVMTDPQLSVQAARIHENAVREDVNAADEAVYLAQLHDSLNLSEAELCRLTRRTESWVGDRFALLRGDANVFEALRTGAISFAVARELNRCHDPVLRKDYLHHAAAGGVASRVVHTWVEQANALPDRPQPAPVPANGDIPGDPAAYVPEVCPLCGGNRDPGNMFRPLWHTYCHERVLKVLKEGEKAAQ